MAKKPNSNRSEDLGFPIDVEKVIADPNFTAPDLMGAVEGWRSWKVSGEVPRYGASPKLYSVTHGNYYWVPRQASVALCGKCDGPKGDGVPGEECSCGFYSAKTLEHLQSMGYHTYDGEQGGYYCVIGQVANWGKVIEGTQGWRAQKSYPVHIYVPFEIWKLAPAIRSGYGCEVSLMNFLKPAKAAM